MPSPKRTRSSPPAAPAPVVQGCTHFKLRQLTRRVGRHYDGIVGTADLKTTQYSLLSHLSSLGPIRPSDLAGRMELDASTLTRNLQPLIAHGWAETLPGVDGRSRLVAITDAGRAKRSEGQRAWKQAQLALNKQLGEARVARLHGLLQECMDLLNDSGEGSERKGGDE